MAQFSVPDENITYFIAYLKQRIGEQKKAMDYYQGLMVSPESTERSRDKARKEQLQVYRVLETYESVLANYMEYIVRAAPLTSHDREVMGKILASI